MAGSSAFTKEQKTAFVALAKAKGRAAAAKKAGVSTTSISQWAKQLGVKFTSGYHPGASKKKAKGSKARTNGKANGHTVQPSPFGATNIPPAEEAPSLDTVMADLQRALKNVAALKATFRQHFG